MFITALLTDLRLIQLKDSVFPIVVPNSLMVINYLKFVLRDALKIIGLITLHISVLIDAQITQICTQIMSQKVVCIIVLKMVHTGSLLLIEILEDALLNVLMAFSG